MSQPKISASSSAVWSSQPADVDRLEQRAADDAADGVHRASRAGSPARRRRSPHRRGRPSVFHSALKRRSRANSAPSRWINRERFAGAQPVERALQARQSRAGSRGRRASSFRRRKMRSSVSLRLTMTSMVEPAIERRAGERPRPPGSPSLRGPCAGRRRASAARGSRADGVGRDGAASPSGTRPRRARAQAATWSNAGSAGARSAPSDTCNHLTHDRARPYAETRQGCGVNVAHAYRSHESRKADQSTRADMARHRGTTAPSSSAARRDAHRERSWCRSCARPPAARQGGFRSDRAGPAPRATPCC